MENILIHNVNLSSIIWFTKKTGNQFLFLDNVTI